MKHTATLYIADKEINKFMGKLDLGTEEEGKVFVSTLQELTFTTSTKVDEEYFRKIIAESKSHEKFWIPAISYMDNFFVDKKVKAISDGKKFFWVDDVEQQNS